MKKLIAISSVLVLLSACSTTSVRTPDYACPLNTPEAGKCASVEQAYEASRQAAPRQAPGVQSVFDPRAHAGFQAAPAAVPAPNSAFPAPGEVGMPVFNQPRVMRVWVAPYVDADGNLRSGEYTYFNTPGQWNYGNTITPGSGSGIFEPARPDRLGFNPVAPQPVVRNSTNASRAAPAPAERGAAAGQPAATQPAVTDSTTAITQPYQRLNTR